ncbi:MAG: hypothetical protein LUF85_17125 [Bacteroides sp.]|nr:hypothetical protein [Bacteroides sp.]
MSQNLLDLFKVLQERPILAQGKCSEAVVVAKVKQTLTWGTNRTQKNCCK